ncbi:MAG: ATP-binding protein [Halanaerobiales bacterium]
MPVIELNPNANDSISDNLSNLFELLESFNISKVMTDSIDINLSNLSFIHPLYSLSLSALINQKRNEGFTVNISNYDSIQCSSYLRVINFPEGIELNQSQLQYYSDRNYLPIVKFPNEETSLNKVLTSVLNLIRNNFSLSRELFNGLYYLISELTDNINQHSIAANGWITAQYYPNKHFIDVCIIDNGIGILNSYKNQGYNIPSHISALENALQGLSAKNSHERGMGIHTSKNMVNKGLSGHFFMCSGNAMVLDNNTNEIPFNWNGVLIFFRISKNISNFNYINFVE